MDRNAIAELENIKIRGTDPRKTRAVLLALCDDDDVRKKASGYFDQLRIRDPSPPPRSMKQSPYSINSSLRNYFS